MSAGLVRSLGLALITGGVFVAWVQHRRGAVVLRPAVWPGLALVLDVWALALQAGLPAAQAMVEAVEVASGPAARCLGSVVAAVADGVGLAEAWELAATGTSEPGCVLPVAVQALARAAVRSETDGTSLEPVLRQLAVEERGALASRGLLAARRASVWAMMPLGLCYLPAYLLLGVVPAVVGLIHGA